MLRNRIFNLIFIAACAVPLAGMTVYQADESAGNESAAEWPSLFEEDGSFNALYLSEIGDYVEDHFAFRSELITANSVLRTSLLNTSTDEDVIAGTDNWLYYAATLDDYQHANAVSDRVLFNEAHNIALVQEWAEVRGKTFVFTIAPNKNTLYPDNMPSTLRITFAGESDLDRLTDYLTAEGVNYVDMVSLFDAQDEVLYYERDSHWTETGAVLAYNALLDAAGIEHETYEGVEPVITMDYYGDLSEMIYPSGMYPEEYELYLTDPSFEYITAESSGVSYLEEYLSDASVLVEQDTVETYNEDGSGSLYMYRDSFGNSLLPYMAETFEAAVFSEIVPWDLTSEEVLAADVIIMEKVERHLPTLSNIAPVMAAVEQNLSITYTSGEVIYGTEEYLQLCVGVLTQDAGSGTGAVGDTGTAMIEAEDSDLTQGTITLAQTTDGNYIEISGAVSEDLCAVNGRIYAAVTDGSGTAVYEAFCVSTDDTDYGYTLYLPESVIDEEILRIRIIVRNGTVWTCACEYRASDMDSVMDEAKALAQEILSTYGNGDPELAWLGYLAVQEVEEAALSDGADDAGSGESGTDSVDREDGDTTQEASEDGEDPSTVVVSRRYIEDCGLDTGYWDITYADGHHEYIDE